MLVFNIAKYLFNNIFERDDATGATKLVDHYAQAFLLLQEDVHKLLRHHGFGQYANQVPTLQYRSANSITRDLDLYEYEGETYCGVTPSPEVTAARAKKGTKILSKACEVVLNMKGSTTMTLSNDKGEQVVLTYDDKAKTFSMDRTKSGRTDFSTEFATVTTAPVHGKLSQLRIFIDSSSIEVFDADGRMSMTNLVFPTKHYNKVTVKGRAKYTVYNLTK